MEQSERLRGLADHELLAALTTIVRRGNEITAELLAHLAELDERDLYLDLGFASLFEYCTVALALCEATAGRRIAATRVCREHPQALARIADGSLHVSALCLLKKHLTAENAAELFDACSHKSARRIEELLAARFPRPDVADLIRRLPVSPSPTLNVESGPDAGRPAADKPSAARQKSAEPLRAQRRLEPLGSDRYGVHFTADSEFRDLLDRVRALASHRLPTGDLMTVLKRGLEAYERELEKQRLAVGRKPSLRDNARSAPTRHIPLPVQRAVFVRDGKRCTFVSKDLRRCGAREFLEFDHIKPWAVDPDHSPSNLRLRCRAHNQRYARLYFGRSHLHAAREQARTQAHWMNDRPP